MKIRNHLDLDGIAAFLEKLAEKSESVYWLSSPDFKRIAYISPAYEKIWGRSRELLYREPELWISYMVPEDMKGYHPIHVMAEKVNKQGPTARYEENYRIIRPDGEIRWITDRGFPVYDEYGNCCGVTGIAIDVTHQKAAEEALKKAKEEAELSNKLKTEFIRNMEHDIRTPFSGILGLAEILWEKETNEEKKELLGDITQSAKDLLDYANGILDFARIELGDLPFIEKKFAPREIVEKIIHIEKPAAKVKNLDLILDCASDVPDVVQGDAYRLERILINLVSNAIKFTNYGSVLITVKLEKKIDSRHIILSFKVKDTGIGIPIERQNFIYKKFNRVSESNKGIYKGIGLGLRIVKQFVEEMNGEIELNSVPMQGSTFICTFPFKLPLTAV